MNGNQQVKIYLVNAFSGNDSGGSPTGVVLNAETLTKVQMQYVARQLPVSHTAFAIEPEKENADVKVRFFTVSGEIANCGHGTVALHYTRAKEFGYTGKYSVVQETKKGFQTVEIYAAKDLIEIYLKQNEITFNAPTDAAIENLLKALGITESDLLMNYPPILASPGSQRFLIGLHSPEKLYDIFPDYEILRKVCSENNSMGCFVYALSNTSPAESSARMFAPPIGVNEDIINGNSSGCLGAYLLRLDDVRHYELLVHQGHRFGREGTVHVKVENTGNRIDTFIGGTAKMSKEIMMTLN